MLRPLRRHQRRESARAGRSAPRADRSQWRGQNDADQSADGIPRTNRGRRVAQRRVGHAPAPTPPRAARPGADLPDQPPVCRFDGARIGADGGQRATRARRALLAAGRRIRRGSRQCRRRAGRPAPARRRPCKNAQPRVRQAAPARDRVGPGRAASGAAAGRAGCGRSRGREPRAVRNDRPAAA